MSFLPPHCSELSGNVNAILDLVSESNLNRQTGLVEASLAKAMQRVAGVPPVVATASRRRSPLSLKLCLQGLLVQVNRC